MKKIAILFMCFLLVGCSAKEKECNCENIEPKKTDLDVINEKNQELSEILINYLKEIYDNDEWMNGGKESQVHKITLKEFEAKGKDISMFVNPLTKKQCDLENTYGSFVIYGTKPDGKTDYNFLAYIACQNTSE